MDEKQNKAVERMASSAKNEVTTSAKATDPTRITGPLPASPGGNTSEGSSIACAADMAATARKRKTFGAKTRKVGLLREK